MLRSFCTTPTKMRRTVIISTSRDIYRNLALEHWLYKNETFETNHLLMLWVNEACVVIGRHQNPWTECNVAWMEEEGIHLARRNSGGGTVYHDAGNLNLSFFTPIAHYHRRTNLDFISEAVYRQFGLRIAVNKRDDLEVGGLKVSGTAARLSRTCAYHHCTLLVAADEQKIHMALQPIDWEIKTNATRSTKAKIVNLVQTQPNISIDSLIKCLSNAFLLNNDNDSIAEVVTPSEENFPGIDTIHEEFASCAWVFGKTPTFTAKKNFSPSNSFPFQLSFTVENGIIIDTDVKLSPGCPNTAISQQLKVAQACIGQLYDVNLIKRMEFMFTKHS